MTQFTLKAPQKKHVEKWLCEWDEQMDKHVREPLSQIIKDVTVWGDPLSQIIKKDVAAWGDTTWEKDCERLEARFWGDAERNQAVKIHQREAIEANLLDVFDEARRINGIIAWRHTLPTPEDDWPEPLTKIRMRFCDAWGKAPDYIEIDDYGWYIYSLKPVWEL